MVGVQGENKGKRRRKKKYLSKNSRFSFVNVNLFIFLRNLQDSGDIFKMGTKQDTEWESVLEFPKTAVL